MRRFRERRFAFWENGSFGLPVRELKTQPVTKRLLVVDDDADMRLTLKLALELAGYAVDVAGNGREALELQRRQPADAKLSARRRADGGRRHAAKALRR